MRALHRLPHVGTFLLFVVEKSSPGLEGHQYPGVDDFLGQGARKGRMGVLRQCCIGVKYAYGMLLSSKYLASCSGASG